MLQKNIKLVKRELRKLSRTGIKHFINGREVGSQSKKTFDNFTPIDETFISKVASGDQNDINKAAQAASKAFSSWSKLPAKKRKDFLYKIAETIEKYAAEITVLEAWDTGQAVRFTQSCSVRGAANFRYFADRIIDAQSGESHPDIDHINFTMRQPIGPVGIITPWNTPFLLACRKIAPALAAGCTVVHKPAELSPWTSYFLAKIAKEAGIPKGVWNVVQGFGEVAGKALTEHPLIKAIAFVGESKTGSAIMQQGAATLKRNHFELGGKNPIIVFGDADLEKALDAAVYMKYSLNGERCTSASRLFLQEDIYDSFIQKLKRRVAKIKVGHPLDPITEVGPLISEGHQMKVLDYGQIAKQEGARILKGAKKVKGFVKGYYVEPTLVDQVRPTMRVAQEEIFGPFLSVIKFKSESEVIQMANDVRYGLTAYVWTQDSGRGQRVARDLEAGMVWINSQNVKHLSTPFGGMKQSGLGREGGDYSFEFYTETKNISVAYGTHDIPKLGNL